MNQALETVKNILGEIENSDIEIDVGEEEAMTICLYSRQEFEEGQLGYRHNHLGESFIGVEEGDWKESWYVIGYDELLGDPIIIDIHKQHFPVYTAISGEGEWEPEILFPSLKLFIKKVKGQKRI